MKRLARFAVTAIALAPLLGIAACAGDPDQGVAPTEDQATAANVEKPVGFADHIAVDGQLPEEWAGGSGWQAITKETNDNVFVLGDSLAYIEGKELQSDGDVEFGGRLIFVDSDGNKSYPVEEQPSSSPVTGSNLKMVTRNGIPYLIYAEEFTEMGDANSMSNSSGERPASSVAVFDGEGTLLRTVKIDGWLEFGDTGADTVRAVTLEGESSILELETGALVPMPVLEGHEWVNNYDGVDIFVSNGSPRTLTDGNWVYTAPDDASTYHPGIVPVGTAIALESSDACTVFDPHSGTEYSELSGKSLCEFGDAVSSQDGSLIAFRGGIYSFPDRKLIPIGSEITFIPQSIADNGDVYGEGADKIGVINAFKGGEPQVLSGATLAPQAVTTGRLAAFQTEEDEDTTVFLLGKKP